MKPIEDWDRRVNRFRNETTADASSDKYGLDDGTRRFRAFLIRTVQRAKRNNIWWHIPRIGRGIISLCIRLPINFRGEGLLRGLVKVLRELQSILSPMYRYYVVGADLAYKISEIASQWGNKGASKWKYDRNYAIFLGMNKLGWTLLR